MRALRTLISVDELLARMAAHAGSDLAAAAVPDRLIVIDCRAELLHPNRGRELFETAHLPGAQFADLGTMLAAPVIPGRTGRHPLPDMNRFVAQASALGIGDDAAVVCYDQGPGAFAARLWWLLRWVGHGSVAVLDGGVAAWQRSDGALAAGPAAPALPARLTIRPTLTRTVEARQLASARVVLDARDAPRYRGDVEPIDTRAGHIPGAVNAPYADNLTPEGVFRTPAELRERFVNLIAPGSALPHVDADADVAVYCGSGVTACHDILALVQAGYAEPALYPGSFSEWITDPARAVATGPSP